MITQFKLFENIINGINEDYNDWKVGDDVYCVHMFKSTPIAPQIGKKYEIESIREDHLVITVLGFSLPIDWFTKNPNHPALVSLRTKQFDL